MPLANTIRWLRFNQGEMTQKELADFVGVSRQTIHAIEANKVSPSLVIAFEIAYALGHTVEEVFYYESEKNDSHDPSQVIIDVEYWPSGCFFSSKFFALPQFSETFW